MPPAPQKPVPTPLLAVAGLVCMLAGAPICALAVMDLGPELALRTHGQHTDARVTEMRTSTGYRRSISYDVRYRFKARGRSWTHSDATGRKNLWTSLPKADWEAARSTHQVDVVYLPEAPRHNRPAKSGAMPLGDKLAGLGLGAFLVLLGLGALVAVVRRVLRNATPG